MNELQRRPIKLRATDWALMSASVLAKAGVSPNQVSIMSAVFSVLGAALLIATAFEISKSIIFVEFVLAAVCIQLRLFCNMIDGLIAVENGKATRSGELYNELPDRISDLVLFVAAGYATSCGNVGITVGWLAACLSLMTAYIRAFGSRYLSAQDFSGPMAKPHRMFALTVGCVATASQVLLFGNNFAMFITLTIVCLGTGFTCVRRVSHLKVKMESD